jgi:uncharacterized protein (DUF1015 family)
MPPIFPFKAVRATRDKVGLVATRAYQSYEPEQRQARMKSNPFSFLHVINPGYKFQKIISGTQRYQLVRNRYMEFKEEGVFIQDKKPALYFYKIINRDRMTFFGLIGTTNIEDYNQNKIKKHEDTLCQREEVFKDYLKTVGFNAEPVLVTYPDNAIIRDIIHQISQERPEYEFTTTYRDTHYLWKVEDKKIIKTIQREFVKFPNLYIADGHHRSASLSLLQKEMKETNARHTGKENYNYLMCYFLPESQLKIHEFNRLVKDLNGLSKEEFLIALDTYFTIEYGGPIYTKPQRKYHFAMYLDGAFYELKLRKKNYSFKSSLDRLDAQILYKTVFEKILGITDLRNDNRLEYVHGKKDMSYLRSQVDQGHFAAAFSLKPATISDLKSIADEGLTMPPKSTYIEPKLRSAITIYELD